MTNATHNFLNDALEKQTAQATIELALGRIFRLGSRPTQPGDVADYERCRRLILDHVEGHSHLPDYSHDYARDRLKGAQGDSR